MLKYAPVIFLCITFCGPSEDFATFEKVEPVRESLTSNYFPELGKGVNLAETQAYGTCIKFPQLPPGQVSFAQRSFDIFSIKARKDTRGRSNASG